MERIIRIATVSVSDNKLSQSGELSHKGRVNRFARRILP